MKKISNKLAIIMSLALVLVFSVAGDVRADGTANFYAYCDADALSGGDTVSVVVAVDNNVPIGAADIILSYDTTKLSYVSSSLGAAASSGVLAASDQDGEVKLSISDNTSTADGTVAIVNFTANGDLDSLPVTLGVNNVYDQSNIVYTDYTVDSDVEMTSAEWASDDDDDDSSTTENADDEDDDDDSGSSHGGSGNSSSGSGSSQNGSGSSSSSSHKSSGTDKTYRTGAGFGNDVYFVFAGIFAVFAAGCFVYNKIKTRE